MSFEDREAIIRQIEDQLQAGITQAGHEDLSVMRLRDQYVEEDNEPIVFSHSHLSLSSCRPHEHIMLMRVDWAWSYVNAS